MIDYTITIGNIGEISSIIIGGMFALSRMRSTIGTKIALLHSDFSEVKSDVTEMKSEIKKVNEVLIHLADIRGEIRVLSTRITANETDIRELRHGHGWVTGTVGIDHEYK
jgi:hypothetical protein